MNIRNSYLLSIRPSLFFLSSLNEDIKDEQTAKFVGSKQARVSCKIIHWVNNPMDDCFLPSKNREFHPEGNQVSLFTQENHNC